MAHSRKTRGGFTIVELLIVIVVIGILAAITIVAFNGVQSRARTTVIRNDIAQAARKLEAAKATSSSNTYPVTQADAGVQASGGNTINYYYDSINNRYCVEVFNSAAAFYSDDMGQTVATGRCTGSGLIGWWTMNNTTNDISSAGNNGAGIGLTATNGQNGNVNSAYSYNGTDSILTVPTNNTFHPDSLTMSIWIRPSAWSTTAATNFISKRNGSSGYFFFYLTSSRTVTVDVGGSGNRWNTQYTPPTDEWTHLVLTINPSAGRSLYVNGALQITNATAPNPIVTNSTDVSIGAETSLGYRLNGAIDDVRMYNRVLSASEVQSLFAQGAQ